jgi:hypothetical protein
VFFHNPIINVETCILRFMILLDCFTVKRKARFHPDMCM